MGTNDLDDVLNYSIMTNAILKYIKDAEGYSSQIKISGLQKKENVIQHIQHNMPLIYEKHSIFIDVMIDTLILVSNNPSVIKADKFYFGCGC